MYFVTRVGALKELNGGLNISCKEEMTMSIKKMAFVGLWMALALAVSPLCLGAAAAAVPVDSGGKK
jgi:hypothetical protein